MNKLLGALISAWFLMSCTLVQEDQVKKTNCTVDSDKHALAGIWLYEEQGYINQLFLDEQGNGSDEWQDIHIKTECLDKQSWHGVWVQSGKEDSFYIGLSSDLKVGKGQRMDNQTKLLSEFQVKRILNTKAH